MRECREVMDDPSVRGAQLLKRCIWRNLELPACEEVKALLRDHYGK